MSNDKRDLELEAVLKKLEPLEDVPAGVSERFEQTLENLALTHRNKKKGFRLSREGTNFAVAASLVLVFGMGALTFLGPIQEENGIIIANQGAPSGNSDNPTVSDDQLLFSEGSETQPVIENSPITIKNSGTDYDLLTSESIQEIGVTSSWKLDSELERSLFDCLQANQLNENINLVDAGSWKGEDVWAVWSPLTSDSWNIYLITKQCDVLERKYLTK
jgi:hypothetical protein